MTSQTPRKQPNILLIHSDQHRYDCIAAHGLRPDIKTPNLDALASEGTIFTRAYSTIPICTPARASLMTGAWPTTHGSFCIPNSELYRAARPELPTLTKLLSNNNYRVAWTGKYHGELEHPLSEEGIEEHIDTWQHKEYLKQQGLPQLKTPHGFFGDVNKNCPPEHSPLAWQADHVIRQMKERRDAPFFIRWDPPEPHLPCNPTVPFSAPFSDAAIPPWQSFPDELDGKPAIQKRQKKLWGLNGWTWEDWLPVVRNYYGIINEMDHHIGRVLEKLDELGLTENTLVIYSTDHGDYCGGHGQIDKHFNMYDDVVHVPLIIRWPGHVPEGSTCDAFASNSIDIAHTILQASAKPLPETFVGNDLIHMASDKNYRPRSHAYAQYFGTQTGAYSCRMIRDNRYKFIYHPVGECHELYDLEKDPGERQNQINNSAFEKPLTQLKAALWDTMIDCGDPLANDWTEVELKNAPTLSEKSNMTNRSA